MPGDYSSIDLYGLSLRLSLWLGDAVSNFTGWSLCDTSAFNTLSTLVVDINYQTAATAAAANNLFGCLMGAGATAITSPLIKSIGLGWTATFIAGLWVLGSPAL